MDNWSADTKEPLSPADEVVHRREDFSIGPKAFHLSYTWHYILIWDGIRFGFIPCRFFRGTGAENGSIF